jgi:hypothetical protein
MDFQRCSCGRQFASKDGLDAHYVALHDAPVEDEVKAELHQQGTEGYAG